MSGRAAGPALVERGRHWLDSHRRLLRRWPLAGSVCLVGLVGLALWWRTPLLVGPWLVAERLRVYSLDHSSSLVLMAARLPVVVLVLLSVMLVVLLFVTVAVANERRLLRMVEWLDAREPR